MPWVATARVEIPPTSAALQLWGDLARDVDSVGLAITQVNADEEQRIGDTIAADLDRGLPLTSDVKLATYLTSVGSAVADTLPDKRISYTFRVINSDDFNAFALPGGHVYVTTGLLAVLTSEAELATVVGHEISHVSLRHCIGKLQYQLAAERAAGDVAAAVIGAAHRLVTVNYDGEQESDADLNGIKLAAAAGYDPRAALLAFQILARLEGGDRKPPQTEVGEILRGVGGTMRDLARTHPGAAQRIADAKVFIDRHAAEWTGKRFYVGAGNFADKLSRRIDERPGEWITLNGGERE